MRNPQWKAGLDAAIDTVAHPIGQIFLRLLFVVVMPLVLASIACGVASLGDLRKLGRLGLRTLLFFLEHLGALDRVRWRRIRMLFRVGGKLYDLGHPVENTRTWRSASSSVSSGKEGTGACSFGFSIA